MSVFTVINNNTALDKAKPTKDLTYVINADTGETYLDVAGTVAGIDDIIRKPLSAEYTAFEVYAHDTRIETGALESQTHFEYIGRAGDVINAAVNPSMTHTFKLRSEQSPEEQDVIVDWGDGAFTKVAEVDPEALVGEYRYLLSHTYAATGTYIVKIYGRTYFSFSNTGISQAHNTSLISRVFEPDLPIASHIWNLSSAFQWQLRLLHVNMYSHRAAYQIKHWSGAFTNARNLIDCVGFTKYSHRESNYNIFQQCLGLVNTDLRIADSPADPGTGNGYAFCNCPKLTVDINSLLPVQGFKSGSSVSVTKLFSGDKLLTGTVPADKLWANKDVTFLNTAEAFSGCSDAIRAQVPTSWGGTNEHEEIRMKALRSIDLNDYTAFEVYAHDGDIAVGTDDPYIGLVSECDIPASKTHRMRIRTTISDPATSNIIIEWGDGTYSLLVDFLEQPTKNDVDKEYDYVLSHTYATTGKYVVKVYGSGYYSICNPTNKDNLETTYNLICRIMDTDLPLASCVTNISSLCAYALRLTSVHVPAYFDLARMTNIGGIFRCCKNLRSVKGLKNQFLVVNAAASIFVDCYALETLEFTMPAVVTRGYTGKMFQNLLSFTGDINSLLPSGGFIGGTLDADYMFSDCEEMSGTVPADQFWNNDKVTWINTATCFTQCSDSIRSQVPVSWGGTNTEIVVSGSVADRLRSLEERLNGTSFAVI